MTSFIIDSKDKKKRLEYNQVFCQKSNITDFDITVIEKDTNSKTQSIGIEDIKNMQKKLFLKPIKSKKKAVILEDAQLLTTEAQNALLKVLEEPPEHTIIILSTQSKETLLPTIISRCQVIELEQVKKELSGKEIQEFTELIQSLPTMAIGDKLKKAEQVAKDKEKALIWIEKIILCLRDLMLEQAENNSQTSQTAMQNIKSFQKLHTFLKTTNVNTRFAIENTLLK